MTTVQLTLKVREAVAGVLITLLMKLLTTEAQRTKSFEYGAVAFFRSNDKVYPCQVFSCIVKNDGVYYKTCRAGVWKERPLHELLTGWESDFPAWDEIDWTLPFDSYFEAVTGYPDEEELRIEEFFDRWQDEEEIDVDYYSKLADEWEISSS